MTPATRRRLEALEAKAEVGGPKGLQTLFQRPDMTQNELEALDAQGAAWKAEGYQVMRIVFVRPRPDMATMH